MMGVFLMKNFSYIARDLAGINQSGYSRALNKNDVVIWLRDQGLMPIEVRIVESAKKVTAGLFRRQKVSSIEKASLCWQLHAMIEGGVSITSALETIADDCENLYFQYIIKQVGENIESGETFSDSVGKFPKVFNQLFCSMITAGESGGSLPVALERLAQHFDSKDKLARKVKGAIAYPAFVITFIIFLVIFIMTFIIPRFKVLFDDIGGELPLITRMFMGTYDLLMGNIFVFYGVIIAAIIGCVMYGKTKNGREVYSRIILKVPLIGKIISQAFIVMFCRTFATLLSAGVSVLDALEIMSTMSNNTVIKSAMLLSRANIVEGSGISLSMSTCNFFPKLLVKMVQVGEESGSLPNILDQTSNYYERKVESTISTVMTVLEPILIVAVGMIVLGVVLALYLPIFSLSDIKQ